VDKNVRGAGGQEGYSVQQTTDGGYVVAGYGWFPGPDTYNFNDVYLVKTNAFGDTLGLEPTVGQVTTTWATRSNRLRMAVTSSWDSTVHMDTGPADFYLIRTNAQGDTLWTRTYGGRGVDGGNSVQQTTDGGFIVAGSTGSFGAGIYDIYLIKTDGELDVGPVAILSPSGKRAVRRRVMCRELLSRNFGLTSGILPVTMEIGSSYAQTMQETLTSVIQDTSSVPGVDRRSAGVHLRSRVSRRSQETRTRPTIPSGTRFGWSARLCTMSAPSR